MQQKAKALLAFLLIIPFIIIPIAKVTALDGGWCNELASGWRCKIDYEDTTCNIFTGQISRGTITKGCGMSYTCRINGTSAHDPPRYFPCNGTYSAVYVNIPGEVGYADTYWGAMHYKNLPWSVNYSSGLDFAFCWKMHNHTSLSKILGYEQFAGLILTSNNTAPTWGVSGDYMIEDIDLMVGIVNSTIDGELYIRIWSRGYGWENGTIPLSSALYEDHNGVRLNHVKIQAMRTSLKVYWNNYLVFRNVQTFTWGQHNETESVLLGAYFMKGGDIGAVQYDKIIISEYAGASIDPIEVTIPDEGEGSWCGVCGNYTFVNEKYYHFNMTFESLNNSQNDFMKMAFITPTAEGSIWNNFTYDVSDNSWSVSHHLTSDVSESVDQHKEPTRTTTGDYVEINATWSSVIYRVWFTEACMDVYNDLVDIWAWANDTSGFNSGWVSVQQDLFRIYNLGGFSLNETVSAGGGPYRPAGGDVWDMEGYTSSAAAEWFEVDIIYRNLQHLRVMPSVAAIIGRPSFSVTWYFDTCTLSDGWSTQMGLRIDALDVTYGSQRHWTWWVTWYDSSWSIVFQENVSMYHGGQIGAPDANASTWFWLDFWFNKLNASSTIGGRFNAYIYPVEDNARSYLQWLSTAWGINDELNKDSICFLPLTNSTGGVFHAPDVQMVRFRQRLTMGQHPTETQYARIYDAMTFEFTLGQYGDPLEGIQTPDFIDTLMPKLPPGGYLGGLKSAIQGFFGWASEDVLFGGLNLWGVYVDFMDVVFAFTGNPNFFSEAMNVLASGWAWLTASFGYALSMITPMFTLLASFMGKFITLLGEAVIQAVATLQGIWAFLDGAYTSGVDLWTDLGIWNWVVLGIILYPIHLVLLWDVAGFNAAEREARLVWDIVGFLISGFLKIIQLVIAVVGRIIESIPVIE